MTTSARPTVRKYAYEAYPMWAVRNPATVCPPNLAALNEYLPDRTDIKDPWGHDYRMLCGDAVPPGVKGLAVFSVGPDGLPNTADDINSWD